MLHVGKVRFAVGDVEAPSMGLKSISGTSPSETLSILKQLTIGFPI